MAFVFTDDNFKKETASWVCLVDFWANWCWPCRSLGPTIEALAKEYEWKAKIGKLDVDDNPITPGMFQISSIPAVKIFKNWQLVESHIGAALPDVYRGLINKHLEK